MLHLVAAQCFSAVGAERGAVWLGGLVLIAAVILSRDRFALEHGVELSGALQRWHTFTPSENKRKENANSQVCTLQIAKKDDDREGHLPQGIFTVLAVILLP